MALVERRVTRYTSHVTRHTSHVTRHTSHVTRHASRVTRHESAVASLHIYMLRHRNSSTLASRRGACARSLSAADKSESRPLQLRDFMARVTICWRAAAPRVDAHCIVLVSISNF